jgi:hypothetical protein
LIFKLFSISSLDILFHLVFLSNLILILLIAYFFMLYLFQLHSSSFYSFFFNPILVLILFIDIFLIYFKKKLISNYFFHLVFKSNLIFIILITIYFIFNFFYNWKSYFTIFSCLPFDREISVSRVTEYYPSLSWVFFILY